MLDLEPVVDAVSADTSMAVSARSVHALQSGQDPERTRMWICVRTRCESREIVSALLKPENIGKRASCVATSRDGHEQNCFFHLGTEGRDSLHRASKVALNSGHPWGK